MKNFPPASDSLANESDVEGLFLDQLLHAPAPGGLEFDAIEIRRKTSIRKLSIGKGNEKKLYYPDYALIIQGIPLVIIEAKGPNENLDDAAREARLYATELNAEYPTAFNPCQYCIVSNGLTTELRKWDSNDIISTFPLEEAISACEEFSTFVDLIGSVCLRKLAEKIHSEHRPNQFFRAGNLVGGQSARNEAIEYNDFGRCLSGKFQEVFDPATFDDRLNIVKNAYVPSKRRVRYLAEIDRVIGVSLPPSSAEAQLIENTEKPKEIVSIISEQLSDLRNKVLLLVGAVGSGKSTFVDYLQNIALPEAIREKTAWVRLNLNDAPLSSNEIYDWCRHQLLEKIPDTSPELDCKKKDGLKKLFRKEIEEFKEGRGAFLEKDSPEYNAELYKLITNLQDDKDLHIAAMERYMVTGRGRLLMVVLDNCDKRNRDYQLLMFQVAKWLQNNIRCLVILPLRDITYENYKNEPPLDTALKDLIFRINPPQFQEVLTRRLKYLFKRMRETGGELSYHAGNKEIKVSTETLEKFLSAVMNSLFSNNQKGRNIIVGLAGSNIRKAFDIFVDFCRSGYIREEEIFRGQATGEIRPLHTGVVARTLFRTNRRYYSGDESYVKNIFQVDFDDSNPDHLVRWRILQFLADRANIRGKSQIKGYCRVADVAEVLLSHGYDHNIILRECSYLYKHGCLVAEHLKEENLGIEDLISITSAGRVHLQLVDDFHYLAACAEDTWLSNESAAHVISNRMRKPIRHSQSWISVLNSAEEFLAYMISTADQSPASLTPFQPESAEAIPPPDFEGIAIQAKDTRTRYESRKRQQGRNNPQRR